MAGRSKVRGIAAAIALIGLGAFAVPVVAGPVSAQTSTTLPGGVSLLNCNVTTYRFLFWPLGHGKVKSQKFPEYKVPHVELYTGTGTKYPDSQSLGYVDYAGQYSHASSCANAPIAGPGGGPIPAANVETITTTTALACTAPSGSLVLTVPTPGKAQINVVITTQTVAAALVSSGRSQLEYYSTMCKPQKAPK